MNQHVDITKLSVTELKAYAYDEVAKVEVAQNNLRVLNAEIAKRTESEPPTSQTEDEPMVDTSS